MTARQDQRKWRAELAEKSATPVTDQGHAAVAIEFDGWAVVR
jgi:hypothetical protein